MTLTVNGKSHQLPDDVNDAITAIMQDNQRLKADVQKYKQLLDDAIREIELFRSNIEPDLEPFGDFESATVTGDAVRTFADASARLMYERAHTRN